jgi:UDP-N-acetylmuramoyl-tripeptide--D-alanyl-D-alanine ligase
LLDFCTSLDWQGRKIYVIGSMLELGSISEEAHRSIGSVLLSAGGDMVFLYGKETETTAEVLSSRCFPFHRTDNINELKQALVSYLRPGDLVLLKGSRGCALEQLTPLFTEDVGAVVSEKSCGGEH